MFARVPLRVAASGLAIDAQFALRQFRKRPAFALTAVAVLALGIGCSAAVFGVVYAALLKPLPYPEPNRLVSVHNLFSKSELGLAGVSALDYVDIRRHTTVFSETAAYFFNDLTLTGAGEARHVDPVNASASLFSILGIKPQLGRLITAEDDRYGASKVALLSDAFWRSAFGADPAVLGHVIRLDNEPYTVIGVMPRTFHFPYRATQLWIPLALGPSRFKEQNRGSKGLRMLARLAPGVTLDKANAALRSAGHALALEQPDFYRESVGWHFLGRPLAQEQTETVRPWLWLTFGIVVSVLLIACSNVGGLLLASMGLYGSLSYLVEVSRREIGIRLALGAARSQVVETLSARTSFAVGCGMLAGIAGASLTGKLLHAQLFGVTYLDPVAWAIGAGTLIVAAVIAASLPIHRALRIQPLEALRDE